MKCICAQPDELFYAWQIEVMLDNFISVGIDQNDIHIIIGFKKTIGDWWFKLVEKYKDVGFYFYSDTRINSIYPPSIVPHLLYKHWERFPWLVNEKIFHHDCDILFTRPPDFSNALRGDVWCLGNTIDYIGAEYIKSKGDSILDEMCSIVNIKKEIVLKNQSISGGAQYLMKNVFSSFWKRVEDKSEKLYKYLSEIETDIQKWTAGMWALLWSAWFFGYETVIDSSLNFSMATDTWPKWDKYQIYHNAGVVEEHRNKLFLKSDFRGSLPYSDDNSYDSDFCSYYYFEKVIETGRSSCLKRSEPDVQNLLNKTKLLFI